MNTNGIIKWVEDKSLTELFETGFLSSYATRHLDKYQKAAVFLITVGLDTASEILKHLPQEEVEKITAAILKTQQISQGITVAIMDELEHTIQEPNYKGGEDYARSLLQRAFNRRTSDRILEQLQVAQTIGHIPFAGLRDLELENLVTLLEPEAPQTVALVLSYLPPQKSGLILARLPAGTQHEVVQRMADTGQIDRDVLATVEQALWNRYQTHFGKKSLKVHGLNVISSVLNQSRADVRENILAGIEQKNAGLAERIRDALFTFDDLTLLTDNAIQLLIRTADRQTLAYALKIAGAPVQKKFFNNMSQRAAALFREEMTHLPPMSRSEVEKKQIEIVALVRRLEQDGKILISRNADEWVE